MVFSASFNFDFTFFFKLRKHKDEEKLFSDIKLLFKVFKIQKCIKRIWHFIRLIMLNC